MGACVYAATCMYACLQVYMCLSVYVGVGVCICRYFISIAFVLYFLHQLEKDSTNKVIIIIIIIVQP